MGAARANLRAAIRMFFANGDAVPIHTLCFAAYEVLHAISRPVRKGGELLFDASIIKEEYRQQWAMLLKTDAAFFKHADRDRDPHAAIQFSPSTSEVFMFFAILALEKMGEPLNMPESIFMLWMKICRPHLLTDAGQKVLAKTISVEGLTRLRAMPRQEFFDITRSQMRDNGFTGPE